jgi:hypothetical protein
MKRFTNVPEAKPDASNDTSARAGWHARNQLQKVLILSAPFAKTKRAKEKLMAAPQQNTTNRRETVEFPANVPVTLALKYSEPRMVAGMNGERAMFTTTDNRVLFLDPAVAGRITELGINVRVPFTITKKQGAGKGAPVEWEVARIAGEQGDGTFAAPKLPEPLGPGPKPPQRATTATGGLAEEGKALVAAYAEILDWSLRTFEGRVKPDEVRALTISAYIQRRQLASAA